MKKSGKAKSTLFWLGAVAGKVKWNIVMLLAVQALLGINSVGFAMLLREIVNAAVVGNRGGFYFAAASFVGLVLFQLVLRAVNRFLEELTRSTLENRFKSRLFDCLLTKDYASVTRTHSGEWMNRLTSDTVVAADGLAQILPGVSGMAVKLVGAILAILWLEPKFLYILLPGGIVLLAGATSFRKEMKKLHKRIQEADGNLRVFLSERLGSHLIIRAFAQEKQMSTLAAGLMAEHKAERMRRNRFSNICNTGLGIAMNGLYVLGAIFCGYGILMGTVSYGNLTAVLQLVSQIQTPFANITGYLPKYYAMLASAERLMEAEAYADEPAAEAAGSFEAVGLRNAAFTYLPPAQGDETTMPVVLDGVTLEIGKGEYAAFTGPSGCGKSTVLKLLMSLYPLDSGQRYLLADGKEQPLTAAQRGLFAYVPQGNQLLAGTIREILTFGDAEKMQQEERLWRALEIACAAEFVRELENGIDTRLAEHGTGLSEGQMQRIAVARAVFSDHPILLLDEATSSLDEATEERMLTSLRAMTDKTVVIVTHRPAVLKICDKQFDFGKLTGVKL